MKFSNFKSSKQIASQSFRISLEVVPCVFMMVPMVFNDGSKDIHDGFKVIYAGSIYIHDGSNGIS